MSISGLSGNEMIAWVDHTSAKWRTLFKNHPEALQLPCDIRETSNVSGLLQHIVAVELRYAERLVGMPETPYADIPAAPTEAVYLVHDKAMSQLKQLQSHDEAWWSDWLEFSTRSSRITGLFDRWSDAVALDEVERIAFWPAVGSAINSHAPHTQDHRT